MRPSASTIVAIREVGPRDGLQAVDAVLGAADRIALVEGLCGAGLRRIEIGSFVSPRAVPQMARTDAVLAGLVGLPGALLESLVLNDRGAAEALEAGCRQLVTVVAASDTFSRRNSGMSRADALAVSARARARAEEAGAGCVADIATAFGCAYEGPVPTATVIETALRLAAAGYTEITLADTIGAAAPNDVEALVSLVGAALGPGVTIGLHFHNTRGMGLANVLRGIDIGVRHFDASVGGIGGCPFSPGATGNISTEDLVHMLAALGYDTGVELDRLLAVGRNLEDTLGFTLPGQLLRAGPRFATTAVQPA